MAFFNKMFSRSWGYTGAAYRGGSFIEVGLGRGGEGRVVGRRNGVETYVVWRG